MSIITSYKAPPRRSTSLASPGRRGLKLMRIAAAALLGIGSLFVSQDANAADSSLVLHFDFESLPSSGLVTDLSGRGNHGWQYNTTNLLTSTNGISGSRAAQFTYVGFRSNDFPNVYPFSQYIAVTNLAGFEYLTNGTISLWARFDTNYDNAMRLLDNGYQTSYDSNATNSWALGRLSTTFLNFITYPPDGSARKVVSWPADVVRPGGLSPDLSTTSFHLYTVTLDCKANRAVAYYDGVPWQTNTIDLPWLRVYGSAAQRWLCIGAMSHLGTPQWGDDIYPNSAYFAGRMDDLRIYNRTLSPDEVGALFSSALYGLEPRNLAIRATTPQAVELSWLGQSNAYYQVEWRGQPDAGPWSALGLPLLSAGGTNRMPDSVVGQAQRFFRVRALP